MKLLFVALGFFLLTSCGDGQGHANGLSGVHLDQSVSEDLEGIFDATVACTGSQSGSFEDLSIVFVARPVLLNGDILRVGEYLPGGFVRILLLQETAAPIRKTIGHEMLHYLLEVNTGDLDPEHIHDLWDQCNLR